MIRNVADFVEERVGLVAKTKKLSNVSVADGALRDESQVTYGTKTGNKKEEES